MNEILTEPERVWMSLWLSPIRERIYHIQKEKTVNNCAYIEVCFAEISEYTPYPENDPSFLESWAFKIDEEFVGMEIGKRYSPQELNLWQ